MRKNWKYLLGSFLLAAGLLLGCAEEAEQSSHEIQAVENLGTENQEPEISVPEELASEAPPEIKTPQETEAPAVEPGISEDGTYTSKEEVAEYLFLYGHLPDNFITKKEAKALGWVSSEGNLGEVAPGKSIGGDYFGNFEGNLPEKEGREYHECDIDSTGGYRGARRIVYSNDGLVYYTEDHYQTFELLYGEE